MQLQKGEKRSLSDLGIGGRCEVAVSFGLSGVDIAAFGLDASKKIGDDRYVILFSNSRSPNGEISLASSSDRASFTLDLDALPASIDRIVFRSEEHTSELQSLMRISYAVFCLKKQKTNQSYTSNQTDHVYNTYT